MSAISLYARDEELWQRARKLAGRQGLSSLVERALGQHINHQEPLPGEGSRRFVLPVVTDDGSGDIATSIEFHGQLIVDSRGFSVEQLPRVRVYRTIKGRLVVYRTWPEVFGLTPSYSLYSDLETLVRDPQALATTWITDEDRLGEHTDLTPGFVRALRKALVRGATLAIDEIELSPTSGLKTPVRCGRDTDRIRRALQGSRDQDVLLVTMYLLFATDTEPQSLSQIEKAFANMKPVSRLGNTPDALKDLQANMRGYLNNDTRKRTPIQRLFTNARRGFWGLSNIGERRAAEVLHQLGMIRAERS